MRIKSIELFWLRIPLKFTFKTSQTSLEYRETIVLKAIDELGNIGYGEVVAFNEPFYTAETLTDSKRVLIDSYIPKLVNTDISHPFIIHELFNLNYPMALAGLENALLDLYAKREKKPIMDVVFNEPTNDNIAPGMVLGDLEINELLEKIQTYQQEGYKRFKIKIKPEDGYTKLKAIREKYPDLQLLADANRSYKVDRIDELKKLDELKLLCLEEPLNTNELKDYTKLQQNIDTPICLDESIQTLAELEKAIELKALRILNIKVGRVGGIYYVKQMIELCRANNIGYWIGSMVETGISKILHVHLASLKDTYIPGDLSSSARYFKKDIIEPEIIVKNGMIKVPKGYGLGVEIDEDNLEQYIIDNIKIGGNKDEHN